MLLHRISLLGRTPPGVRGLKPSFTPIAADLVGRTPPGVRGLKLYHRQPLPQRARSHPTRGAWIETPQPTTHANSATVAPHPGCVD